MGLADIPEGVFRKALNVLSYMQNRQTTCPGDLEEIFCYEETTAYLLFYLLEKEGLVEKIDPQDKEGLGHYYKIKKSALFDNLSQEIEKMRQSQ